MNEIYVDICVEEQNIVGIEFDDCLKENVTLDVLSEDVTNNLGGETYAGEYVVTPQTVEQSLKTKNKVMVDDLLIKEIPYYEVSNQAGGKTFVIGGNL